MQVNFNFKHIYFSSLSTWEQHNHINKQQCARHYFCYMKIPNIFNIIQLYNQYSTEPVYLWSGSIWLSYVWRCEIHAFWIWIWILTTYIKEWWRMQDLSDDWVHVWPWQTCITWRYQATACQMSPWCRNKWPCSITILDDATDAAPLCSLYIWLSYDPDSSCWHEFCQSWCIWVWYIFLSWSAVQAIARIDIPK